MEKRTTFYLHFSEQNVGDQSFHRDKPSCMTHSQDLEQLTTTTLREKNHFFSWSYVAPQPLLLDQHRNIANVQLVYSDTGLLTPQNQHN